MNGKTLYPILGVGDIKIYQDADENSFIVRDGVVICWAELTVYPAETCEASVSWRIPEKEKT